MDQVSGEIHEGLAGTRRQHSNDLLESEDTTIIADFSDADRMTIPGPQNGAGGLSPIPSQTVEANLSEAIKTINTRVDAWRRGEVHSPVSAEQSDSSIDWAQPDTTPSDKHGSFPFWARHNERIEAKIDKTRRVLGVLNQGDLTKSEQKVFDSLQEWLEEWRDCCVVCHFQLLVPKCPHRTLDCDSALGRHVQSMASLFQPRMLRYTQGQILSCPWCLVPRIICDRWTQRPRRKWAETGRGCQYPDIIIPVILVMVDADSRIRCAIDRWMDFFEMQSRNLDMVCEWFSQRTRGRPGFYGIRAVDTFWQLKGPWL